MEKGAQARHPLSLLPYSSLGMAGIRNRLAPPPFRLVAFFPTDVLNSGISRNLQSLSFIRTISLSTEPLGVITGARKVDFPLTFTFLTTRTRLFAIAMISLSPKHLGGENLALARVAKTRQSVFWESRQLHAQSEILKEWLLR